MPRFRWELNRLGSPFPGSDADDFFYRQDEDFGAHMDVELVNDGPATLVLDTNH